MKKELTMTTMSAKLKSFSDFLSSISLNENNYLGTGEITKLSTISKEVKRTIDTNSKNIQNLTDLLGKIKSQSRQEEENKLIEACDFFALIGQNQCLLSEEAKARIGVYREEIDEKYYEVIKALLTRIIENRIKLTKALDEAKTDFGHLYGKI